jgi:hypothetical protein
MMTYDETMAWGTRQYADVLTRLNGEGLPATFIQTGGMCAAIEVQLEAGFTLLLADAEDSLSWERATHEGWWVGMYPPTDEHDGPIAYAQDDSGDTGTLLRLITDVLRRATAQR